MTNPRARRAGWSALILAAVAALFFARMRLRVDPDVFFHLREGLRVLAGRRLPLTEDASFTRSGTPMIAVEWLSSVVFAGVFAAGGYPAVAGLCVLLTTGALFFVSLVWDEDLPDGACAVILCLVAFGLLNFALAKVQCFTMLLFALFLFWARLWERGRRWAPWAMAATLVPWVNLHGGFMLGWVLLGAVCVLEFASSRRAVALAPWAAGALACVIHPNGVLAFAYPIWFLFAAPAARGLVSEWRPLGLAASSTPYALLVLALVASRAERLRTRFPWLLTTAALLLLGLRTRKMLPYFSLSAGAALGLAWPREAFARARTSVCLAGALAALGAIAVVEVRESHVLAAFGPAADWERQYPREAAERAAALFPGRRLFAPYEWGGYLLYRLSGRAPIFIDGRLEPYWSLLDDYEVLIRADPGWRELAARYRVETALLPPGSALARALAADHEWRAVGDDGRAVLYARRDLRF